MEGKGVVTRIDGKTCLVLRRRMSTTWDGMKDGEQSLIPPDEPVVDAYRKGRDDGYVEGREDGIEVGRKQMKADILEWLGGHYPKGA